MANKVSVLSESEVAEIGAWKTNSYGSMVNLPVAKRDALCATVKALREQYESAVSDFAVEMNSLRGQLSQVEQERNDLRRDNGKLSGVIFANKHAQLMLASAVALCKDKAAEWEKRAQSPSIEYDNFRYAGRAKAATELAAELENLDHKGE